jgi:hypothetical protein
LTAASLRDRDVCPECQVGTLQSRTVPCYATLRGTVVTIPYFPAWVCDVCRYCEYDEAALEELRSILGPAAELPGSNARRRRLTSENPVYGSRTDTRRGSK